MLDILRHKKLFLVVFLFHLNFSSDVKAVSLTPVPTPASSDQLSVKPIQPTDRKELIERIIKIVEQNLTNAPEHHKAALLSGLNSLAKATSQAPDSDDKIKYELNALFHQVLGEPDLVLNSADLPYWVFTKQEAASGHFASTVFFKRRGKKWFVDEVLFPNKKGNRFKKGDEVLTIEDKPFDPHLIYLAEPVKNTLSVELKRAPWAAPQKLPLIVSAESEPDLLLSAVKESRRLIPIGKQCVGYLRLYADIDARFADTFLAEMRDLKKACPKAILDLRGGVNHHLSQIIEALKPPQAASFPWPDFILINNQTGGTREVLAILAKQEKKSILIGTPTAGSRAELQNHPVKEMNWMVRLPLDTQKKQLPVDPDILINDPFIYSAGNDPELDKAIEMARR
jgi:hypothetical protein